MKRSISFFFVSVFLFSIAAGQGNFIRTYGTTTDRDHFYDVTTTQDGNYLFVGTTRAGTGTSNPSNDGLIIKTDVAGNELWSTRRGHTTRADYFLSVWEDTNGDLFVFGSQTQTGLKEYMILAKYDQWGTWIWEKRFGGMSARRFDEQGHGISGDQNSLYLFGTAYDVLPGGDADGYVLVFDKNGNNRPGQSNVHGSIGADHLRDGIFSSTYQSLLAPGMTNSVGAGEFEAMLAVIDPSGTSNLYAYGTSAIERAETILEHSGGQILLGGFRTINGQDDILIISTDINGNVNWSKTYATVQGGNERCYSLTELSNGDIACVGKLSLQSNTDDDVVILQITPTGSMTTPTAIRYGGTKDETGFSSTLTRNNALLIAGWSNSPEYTHGMDDCLAIKVSGNEPAQNCFFQYAQLTETNLPLTVSPRFGISQSSFLSQTPNMQTAPLTLQEITVCTQNSDPELTSGGLEKSFNLFFDATTTHLILRLPLNDYNSASYYIYDVTGKLINQGPISSGHMALQVPILDLAAGMYILSIRDAGKVLWSQKWIKK